MDQSVSLNFSILTLENTFAGLVCHNIPHSFGKIT